MRRETNVGRVALVAMFISLAASCGKADSTIGGETNWLKPCDTSNDCTESACHCGVCTWPCDGKTACPGHADAMCALESSESFARQCAAVDSVEGLCLPTCSEKSECDAGQVCLGGSCVLAAATSTDGYGASGGTGGEGAEPIEASPTTCATLETEGACKQVMPSSEYAGGECFWSPIYRVTSGEDDCPTSVVLSYACEFFWGSNAGSVPTAGCEGFGVWWRADGDDLLFIESSVQEVPSTWQRCDDITDSSACSCGCSAMASD